MAKEQRSCSVDNCKRAVLAKGLCGMHYQRQARHGNPLPGDPPLLEKGSRISWLTTHVDHQGDDCLIWPYGRATGGYGSACLNGRNIQAHRAMCILAHGEPPTPKHEAAHSCGRGPEGCVNPRHLRWATSKENHEDRIIHGTSNRGEKQPNAKLTEDAVREILRTRTVVTPMVIAKKYGVSRGTIYDIYHGRTWGWLSEATDA